VLLILNQILFMKKFIFLVVPFFYWGQNQLFIPDTLSGPFIPLEIKHDHVHFFSGNQTETMGINGPILAPTLILTKGQQVTMQVTNVLFDTTTIHWHGMHVAPENDGGPHTTIPPFSMWEPSFEVMDHAATYWYHPHLHHMTNMHVQMGIAGMIIVRDPEESALNLPRTYGIDDIPVIIQTKGFDSNNQIVVETALDTTVMVNATLKPLAQLPAQVVRMRLLNGSSERVYNLGFTNNASFHVIGGDAGLLNTPVQLTRLKLAPGERAEILVNLTGLNGQFIHLISYGSELANGIYGAQQPGMGAGQSIPNYTLNPLNGSDFEILEIQVIPQTTNPITTIPTSLIQNNPWSELNSNATKTLTFSPQTMGPTAINGPFLINNTTFNMEIVNYSIPLNNTEIWTLQNNSPIAHPFHIHNVPFYILDINGVAPPAELSGRKDVVLVPGGQGTVRFITKFEDFANPEVPYMYHCHMLTHEDEGMMGQFIVYDPLSMEEELDNTEIRIFPNPASSFINIESEKGIKEIIVHTIDGKSILTKFVNPSKTIDVSNLMDGSYVLELKFENGTRIMKKVTIFR
jgi:blue copper oxidase